MKMPGAVIIAPSSGLGGVVKIMLQVPESVLLFIGPAACARHDILSAGGAQGHRAAHLCLNEMDVALGSFPSSISEATGYLTDVQNVPPAAIMLYSGCQDALAGTDYGPVLAELTSRYGISARHFDMNRMPSPKKEPLIERLHSFPYQFLDRAGGRDSGVNLLGSMLQFAACNELADVLRKSGVSEIRHIGKYQTFLSYQDMTRSALNIVIQPNEVLAAKEFQRRFGIPWIFLPVSYTEEEIEKQYALLGRTIGRQADLSGHAARVKNQAKEVLKLCGRTELIIDGAGTTRPYDMVKALIMMGFRVKTLYANPPAEYEQPAWVWLKRYAHTVHMAPLAERSQALLAVSQNNPIRDVEGTYFGYAAVSHLLKNIQQGVLR